jgi:putative oxidoreductase
MLTREKTLDLTVLLVRISAAIIFIQAGGFKIFGWFGGMHTTGLLTTAGWIEVVGGILILLGLFTRPVAFILSGEMAVAFFLGHVATAKAFWPIVNHGELAFLLCFIFLFLSAYGAGKYSLDKAMRNRKAVSAPVQI